MTTQQVLLYVAILVALALVVALIARARVKRKRPEELPPPIPADNSKPGEIVDNFSAIVLFIVEFAKFWRYLAWCRTRLSPLLSTILPQTE